MKKRTIEEVHDKYIGHTGFASFVDKAIEEGHELTNIREFYTKYKFEMDGVVLEFVKYPKCNWKWQYEQCERLVKFHKEARL